MKLTKYGHACFIVEEQGQRLIVDPGAFTKMPEDVSNISVLIITHEHGDHFVPENIELIRSQNPEVTIFAASEVAEKIADAISPENNTTYDVGPFSLEFYGDLHEFIREGIPQPHNLGVNINQIVTYPGDSLTHDTKPAKVLLAPAGAPWLRIKEAAEFVANSTQELIIPTHDAVLSEIGQQTHDNHLRAIAEQTGKHYQRLAEGESIEI